MCIGIMDPNDPAYGCDCHLEDDWDDEPERRLDWREYADELKDRAKEEGNWPPK